MQKTTINYPARQGPEFEVHRGLWEPHTTTRQATAQKSELLVVILLECLTEQMGFYEFSEVCYYKSKLLFWGFFSSIYILISPFIFGAYEVQGTSQRVPLELGLSRQYNLPSWGSPRNPHSTYSSRVAAGTDLIGESVTTSEALFREDHATKTS